MKVVRLMFANMITNKREWIDYQRRMFSWHNQEFFDFNAALSPEELRFIERCIDKSADARLISRYFSLFSYSHKVDPSSGEVNSSRLAYGTLRPSEELAQMARSIAHMKQWPIEDGYFEDSNLIFYGLGWDIVEQIDKIYFFVQDIRTLPSRLKKLISEDPTSLRRRGILSLSFRGQEVAEEKLYVFPRTGIGYATAVLRSAGRRLVQQQNLALIGRRDMSRFSATSQRIVSHYLEHMGTILDAFSINEETGVETLYFDYET